MTIRRKYNWPEIFTAYEQSDQTQVEFCKQNDINPKYFNLKLGQRNAPSESPFSKIDIRPASAEVTSLLIEVGNCKVHCPPSMPIQSFATLVRSLA